MKKFIFLITYFCLFSCKKEAENTERKVMFKNPIPSEKLSFEEQIKIIKVGTSNDSILADDIQFINDSILKGKFKLDISKYQLESNKKKCYPMRIEKKTLYEYYTQGFENLGDLNGDGKKDAVFVLHGLNWCEEGDSYYFTDNTIPRIQTDSYCCHPESVFSIGDIDEDGGTEIGEYHSSCTSNYKSINIWTLKKDKWKLIESFAFFYDNKKYEAFKDFNKMYKKIGKNKFKFLEISDMKVNGEVVMEWKTVTMK